MGKQTVAGAKLYSWRIGKDLSQEVLASQLNVSRAYVSMLEQGDRRPGFDIMFQLRDLAGINPDDWTRT